MTDEPDLAPFEPVPSRKTVAGWTVERQREFIRELAATGSVTHAAAHVGMSVRSACRLHNRPDAEDFDRAWRKAIWRAGSCPLSYRPHSMQRARASRRSQCAMCEVSKGTKGPAWNISYTDFGYPIETIANRIVPRGTTNLAI